MQGDTTALPGLVLYKGVGVAERLGNRAINQKVAGSILGCEK